MGLKQCQEWHLRRTFALEGLEYIADAYLPVSAPVALTVPQLLTEGAAIREAILARCRVNLETLHRLAADHPSVDFLPVGGGWSAVLRVPAVIGEEELCLRLIEDRGVAVHPGRLFGFKSAGWLVISLLPSVGPFAEGARLMLDLVTRIGESTLRFPIQAASEEHHQPAQNDQQSRTHQKGQLLELEHDEEAPVDDGHHPGTERGKGPPTYDAVNVASNQRDDDDARRRIGAIEADEFRQREQQGIEETQGKADHSILHRVNRGLPPDFHCKEPEEGEQGEEDRVLHRTHGALVGVHREEELDPKGRAAQVSGMTVAQVVGRDPVLGNLSVEGEHPPRGLGEAGRRRTRSRGSRTPSAAWR